MVWAELITLLNQNQQLLEAMEGRGNLRTYMGDIEKDLYATEEEAIKECKMNFGVENGWNVWW